MAFSLSSAASTWTTALGYAPAGHSERIVNVVGRPDFPMGVYPLSMAWCLATATLPRPTPAWTVASPARECLVMEPERRHQTRDLTAERAVRLASVTSTTTNVVVTLGTGALDWSGFPPVIAVSTKRSP